jgi:predicted transposase YdaD
LQTWFFERFKHLSEEEVLDMLPVLAPLEETRAYKSIFAKGMVKGKTEGKAEGEARGKAELLKRLIQRRFKQLPKWAVAKIDKADVMQLDALAEAIFDAQDIETLLNS